MDIMTTLFDQDYITDLYGQEREEKGIEKGRFESFFNLMHNLKLTSQQALDAIGVSASEREKYLKMLSEVTSQK